MKDKIGLVLIVVSVTDLVGAFTVAYLHDYHGMFQSVTTVAQCFNPFNFL